MGLGAAATLGAQAQGRGKARGTIQDAEIEVVKDRVNTLPEATRNFEKIKLAPPPKATRQLTYSYPDFRLPAGRLNPVSQVLTVAPETLEPLTGNYAKLGVGNYGTVYGRAHLHSTRNEQYSYGLDLRHQSSASGPVDGKNSAVAQTSVAATGEYYLGQAALGASLDYARERYHFYGYDPAVQTTPPDPSNIQQTFNRFGVRGYVRNHAPEAKFTYELGVGYKYWKNDFGSSENNFLLDGKAGYALGESSRITVQANGSFITEKEDDETSKLFPVYFANPRHRNFVQVTPAYEFNAKEGLTLQLGATLGYSNEPLGNGKNPDDAGKGAVYPAIRVGYNIVPEKFQLYAGLGGAIQRVTLYDLTQENPWLAGYSSQRVADTRYGPNAYIGFTAAPASGLSLAARASYGRARNLYFYNLGGNSLGGFSGYGLVYDSTNVGVLSVHADLLYSRAEKWRAGLKADYNHYGLDKLAHPYGRPALVSTLYGTYNASSKLLLGADFSYYSPNWGTNYVARDAGSVFPRVPQDQQTTAVVDLSLRAEYRITPKFSIFALGNNLANRRYQRFLNYPVKGINVIGGVGYTF
ncbi:hypothetical protein HHL22_03435 [Hymenobacter sp. RP-2-7]|uniref:TonB-dependent receptor n=1 Tax=Hymenobacter polaris TaxID=2682546 RepID=A0A7Y0ABE5_9BACT|nr:hypothetical protein [Hymenobacter polaris]NML64251.1 hypothetical protein [Hymenobacter polaris]